MAKKFTEEEKNERIELIGEYFLETGASTREIAKHFSENQFKISNKTVSLYIKEYIKKHEDKKDELKAMIDNNIDKSIEDLQVQERVLKVVRLVLLGSTKEEIANMLNISVKVVERDLSSRFPRLCEKDENYSIYYDSVMEELHRHQVSTIEKNRKVYK